MIKDKTGRDQTFKYENIRPFTKKLIGFQQRIKYLITCHTYNEINAVSNTTNLLSHSNFTLIANEGIKDLTVKQFLRKIFV